MTDIRQELLAAFDVEHKEHLRAIRGALDTAERGRAIDLKDVFRRAHSLKGAARAVDLPVVEGLAHRLEAVFSRVAEGAIALDRGTIGVIQLGLDGIEGFVAALTATQEAPPAPREAIQALDRLLGRGGGEGGGAPPPPVAARPAEAGGEPAETAPSAPDADEAAPSAGPVKYLRIDAEQVERLVTTVHALSDELQKQGAFTEGLRGVDLDARSLRREWDALLRQANSVISALRSIGGGASSLTMEPGEGERTARALEERVRGFDRSFNAFSRRLAGLVRDQKAGAWNIEQASRQVREDVDRILLVPADEVLGSLGRMAREIAREAGLDVSVRLEGMDVQADRRVLQALKDPAVHLLRNAIGHGIEPTEERRARGKPPQAEIGLKVASRGGRLVLTVFDDGRGPDLVRIEERAVRQGLLRPRASGEPPPPADQLLALVFEPGFSTAEEVDRLSGRGMGLSVAAEAARRLRGIALLRPRRPWGTEAVISVPFSAARQPLLLVEAEGRVYGLPTHGIERLLRLPAASLESVEGRPAVRIETGGQDVVAPVVGLVALLEPHAVRIPIEAGYVNAVLLRRGQRRCAVAVGALRDVRTLLVGETDAPGLDPELVSGVTLLEDDVPALVLSPEGLVGRWMRDEGRLASAGLGLVEDGGAPPGGRTQASATILVVDDSITTRTLEKSILEAQGYRVVLSVDGLDALNLLRSGEAVVDLVVADVEMPRMDGFGLLQAMKNDPRLAPIPVILMTSRADPEDVRRGLELGAGAYITKQKFDQRELLATIGQML